MAISKRVLTDDERYLAFVKRYALDCTRFAVEVCRLAAPTHQQIELFKSVSMPGSRTSVSSGHGCFGRGTSIMLHDGRRKPVERIRTGDVVMGADGRSRRRVEELKRGREAMYRFTYADGTGHDFNESHVLCLIGPDGNGMRATVADYLSWDAVKRAAHTAYRFEVDAMFMPIAGHINMVPIVEVASLGEGQYYGFTLDGDGLFLLGDGTVTSNTGKTSGFAIIALWHLLCYRQSNTIISAPKIKTVHDGIWKEFADLSEKIRTGPQSWIREYFEIESEKVYVKGFKLNWWVIAKTAPRGSPENLAGAHRDWLLWLVDEASGVPDANYGVITGSLTDARNRMAIASQPTRSSGFFYDTHHKLAWGRGGVWNNLVFNSEFSPIVSAGFIAEKRAQYTDEEYAIKVQGRFPETSSKYLLGKGAIQECIGRNVIRPGDHWGWILPVDVSGGGWRDETVMPALRVVGMGEHGPDARRAQLVSVPLNSNNQDPSQLHGRIMEEGLLRQNSTAMIDADGLGLVVCKALDNNGYTAYRKVRWGQKPFAKELKDRYFNQRAQAVCGLSRAVQEGRFGVDPGISPAFLAKMLDQGSRIPFHWNEKGQRVIMPKDEMRSKENLPSPDVWDALSFTFLEGAIYSIADEALTPVNDDQMMAASREVLNALGLNLAA
ncbi:Hint domain-containing homing endonuclease [Burkholderia gladioli]|uniref:Hint domain-containing homing endonuclease n=1 Tax=Burkholderia gladioli TaxID=28095 RepID=UPI001641928A|nr:Hint domain-containing homing endonuclease [Burkholderia gladioli]